MKDIKHSIVCICIALLVIGCNEEKSVFSKTKKDVGVVSKSEKPFFITENVGKLNELKDVESATNQELIKWLPDRIVDYKRVSFYVDKQGFGDISSITGRYAHEVDDSIRFDVNVIDGAGKSSEVFTMVYVSQFSRDFEELHEDGFSKSIVKNNEKFLVAQNDRYNTAEIEYLESKRYYIKFSGRNMNVEKLWEIAELLKTERLPGL